MSDVIKHTTKLWERKNDDGTSDFLYWCPGCKQAHTIPTPRWKFNGDVNNPTFSPSVRHYTEHWETKAQTTYCHYHVQEGEMRYCGDCPHEYNAKNIPMQDIPTDYDFN